MRMTGTIAEPHPGDVMGLSGRRKVFVISWDVFHGTGCFIWNGALAAMPARIDDQR